MSIALQGARSGKRMWWRWLRRHASVSGSVDDTGVAFRDELTLRADALDSERQVVPVSTASSGALPSLLRYAQTWRVIVWWTAAYGTSSWLLEYFASRLDPSGPIAFWFASNRFVYAVVWSGAIVVAILATEWLPVTSTRQIGRILFHTVVCFIVSLVWGVIAYYACLAIVPGWVPLGVAKMLSTTAKNVLLATA